jgi:tetratricopeptide (TPR) repeat protein
LYEANLFPELVYTFKHVLTQEVAYGSLLHERRWVEKALSLVQQALELVRTYKERGNEAWILRLLGEIAARCDPPEVEQAETPYHEALALANELGMRPLQAHCYRSLGTLYGQAGRGQQARAALSTAIALYQAMEMTF